MITQTEEDTLNYLDKMINWYAEHKPEVKTITVTQKQYNALMRISKKAEKGEYRRVGELDLKDNIYRGFDISTIEMRRSRRRKDTEDMFI